MAEVTIGGDRLGAGGKRKVQLHNYERSTHNKDLIWRSTMASGTLVPFLTEVGLPGDTYDIDLDANILTHPTIGPLFGSYKAQFDIFVTPMKLYNGKLNMNMQGIGLKMDTIKFPTISLYQPNSEIAGDNEQINSSCILNYLGIKGVGKNPLGGDIRRDFNAMWWLNYWDAYKNYYANKQEGIGYVIHDDMNSYPQKITQVVNQNATKYITDNQASGSQELNLRGNPSDLSSMWVIHFELYNFALPVLDDIKIVMENAGNEGIPITRIWRNITSSIIGPQLLITCQDALPPFDFGEKKVFFYTYNGNTQGGTKPELKGFFLDNIDKMRMNILKHVDQAGAFIIDESYQDYPYAGIFAAGVRGNSRMATQEGLGIKTYQSDKFNNWLDSETIDGTNGINEISAIDTSGGSFNINTLLVAKKVFDVLNRVQMSGGTYDDYLDAVYTHDRVKSVSNPIYAGGLSKELVFQEVVSLASTGSGGTGTQPLGTLAGRGKLNGKHKGGKIRIKIDEPSIILGIVSLTPRVDYSQGNRWETNLQTMADLHIPGMDGIGFQDLNTDQMAYWDTDVDSSGNITYKSAGKIPAWTDYMTSINETHGNFADKYEQMFMTLNRRYERGKDGNIKDLTTYVDPSKFNYIFADTRLDAQNFWVQIEVKQNVRRKMSAKVMPNM